MCCLLQRGRSHEAERLHLLRRLCAGMLSPKTKRGGDFPYERFCIGNGIRNLVGKREEGIEVFTETLRKTSAYPGGSFRIPFRFKRNDTLIHGCKVGTKALFHLRRAFLIELPLRGERFRFREAGECMFYFHFRARLGADRHFRFDRLSQILYRLEWVTPKRSLRRGRGAAGDNEDKRDSDRHARVRR